MHDFFISIILWSYILNHSGSSVGFWNAWSTKASSLSYSSVPISSASSSQYNLRPIPVCESKILITFIILQPGMCSIDKVIKIRSHNVPGSRRIGLTGCVCWAENLTPSFVWQWFLTSVDSQSISHLYSSVPGFFLHPLAIFILRVENHRIRAFLHPNRIIPASGSSIPISSASSSQHRDRRPIPVCESDIPNPIRHPLAWRVLDWHKIYRIRRVIDLTGCVCWARPAMVSQIIKSFIFVRPRHFSTVTPYLERSSWFNCESTRKRKKNLG